MKAFTVTKFGAATDVLTMADVEKPAAGAGEILVKNMAIATNPIDFKVIQGILAPGKEGPDQRLIVGWDSAGVVEAVGEGVTAFKAGDEVWFAGDITKDGTYAQYTKIDARLVAKKPASMSFEDAAALPLTFQTAWEGMVESMCVQKGRTIFVLNGAGGLGSVVIQLAKQRGLTVIASASRDNTIEWCKQMGADYVINHRKEDLKAELKAIGFDSVDYVFNAHENDRFNELMGLLGVDGKIAVTFGLTPELWAKVDIQTMWFKRISLVHCFMFSRAMFGGRPEMVGELMAEASKLVDAGAIKTTCTKKFESWEEMKEAIGLQMSGKAVGKICLTVKH